MTAELPEETLAEVETLTRRARRAVDGDEAAAYRRRRDELLDEHGFVTRVREDDRGDVLVCHPAAWIDDGLVRTDRVEDVDRAVEIPLEGPGDPDEWEAVAEHNRHVVRAVRAAHGEVHAANAAAFAEFMNNHYAKPIESAAREEVREFLEDYYVRNVWPTDEEAAVVEESVERVLEAARE